MTYVLDTNAVIGLMRGVQPLTTRVRGLGPAPFAVSSISLAELWFGAARSRRPARNRADQDAALAPFRVLDFDARAADRYASVRAQMEAKGKPIGDRDLLIAATALAHGATLVTHNVRELSRVPGLRVEDWMA